MITNTRLLIVHIDYVYLPRSIVYLIGLRFFPYKIGYILIYIILHNEIFLFAMSPALNPSPSAAPPSALANLSGAAVTRVFLVTYLF